MGVKIIGISCSPRHESNSLILLQECLESVAARGAVMEIFKLKDMKFSLCTGCEKCSETGECIFNDDLVELFTELATVDKLVFAAPVFSMGINALGKALVDRVQTHWARRFILNINDSRPKREAYLIATAGRTIPGVFDCSVKTFKYFCAMTGFELTDSLLINPVDRPGEVRLLPETLQKARNLLEFS